jgi:hypothetical protein
VHRPAQLVPEQHVHQRSVDEVRVPQGLAHLGDELVGQPPGVGGRGPRRLQGVEAAGGGVAAVVLDRVEQMHQRTERTPCPREGGPVLRPAGDDRRVGEQRGDRLAGRCEQRAQSGAGHLLGRGGGRRRGEDDGRVEADGGGERRPGAVQPAGDPGGGQPGGPREVAVADLVRETRGGAHEGARGGQPSGVAGAGHDGRPGEAAQRAGCGRRGRDRARLGLGEDAQQQDVVAGEHPLGLADLVAQRQAEPAEVRLPPGVQVGSQV